MSSFTCYILLLNIDNLLSIFLNVSSIVYLNNWEKWREVVCSFKLHDVYYLPNYVKAFEINGDGTPLLLYFEADGLRAINVVMKRDLSDFPPLSNKVETGKFFDLITPYGYGGFIIEEAQVNDLYANPTHPYTIGLLGSLPRLDSKTNEIERKGRKQSGYLLMIGGLLQLVSLLGSPTLSILVMILVGISVVSLSIYYAYLHFKTAS